MVKPKKCYNSDTVRGFCINGRNFSNNRAGSGIGVFMGALTKIFGTHSERELKRIYPLVDKVEAYRDSMQKLSDEELRNKTK